MEIVISRRWLVIMLIHWDLVYQGCVYHVGLYWLDSYRRVVIGQVHDCFVAFMPFVAEILIQLVTLFVSSVVLRVLVFIGSIASSSSKQWTCVYATLQSMEVRLNEDGFVNEDGFARECLVLMYSPLALLRSPAVSSLLAVVFERQVQVCLLIVSWLFRVRYLVIKESFTIGTRQIQDGSIYGIVNSLSKSLMRLYSILVLHLFTCHVCGFLLPQHVLQPLALHMLLLVYVVLQSSLQDKVYGQCKASDGDAFDKLEFFSHYQSRLQRQGQDCGFNGYIIVACSGWLRSLLDFIFCSLPRPPEQLMDSCHSSCYKISRILLFYTTLIETAKERSSQLDKEGSRGSTHIKTSLPSLCFFQQHKVPFELHFGLVLTPQILQYHVSFPYW